MGTEDAAELMLSTKRYYTAATLGKALQIPAQQASGYLYNIRMGKKYKTQETDLPNREVKLISIKKRESSVQDLWTVALGIKQPS